MNIILLLQAQRTDMICLCSVSESGGDETETIWRRSEGEMFRNMENPYVFDILATVTEIDPGSVYGTKSLKTMTIPEK